ncbi:MAG: hypothetical protein RJQ04_16155 [Longimicrobiales bacterium]
MTGTTMREGARTRRDTERWTSRRFRHAAGALALAAGLVLAAPSSGHAQAAASDVATVDGIIAALYDVISGPAGEARDWDRFLGLFIPEGARLIPSGVNAQGVAGYQIWTPQEYVERAGASLEQNGFFEREIGRASDTFGNVVHVFSAYDSKRTAQDPEPFARGINSIQLFHDGSRYWIVSIFWNAERPGLTIPARYLNR